MAEEVLSDRALNRATLARPLLLERSVMTPVDAVRTGAAVRAEAGRLMEWLRG